MNDDRLEEILNSIGAEEIPAEARKIAQDASNNFNKFLRQPSQPAKPSLLELIMRSRTTKLAAAAVIVIAVLAGLPFLPKNTASVTLAGVAEKLGQVKAIMYRMKMHVTGSMVPGTPQVSQDMESTIIISNDFGMKMEMDMTDPNTGKKTTQQMYVVPDSKLIVMVMPEQKRFTRMEFSDDLLAQMKKQNNDPREIIKQMMGCEYTELGRSTIDGVEVDGFQTTDPTVIGGVGENVTLTLWVDAESWLPVRSEIDFDMGEKMKVHGVVSEFNWDLPVTAEDFKPVIPDDFEPMASGMQMPKISEEGLIEGLRLFAELSGSYPKKLSMMELAQETMGFMTNRDVLEKIKEKIPQARGLDEDELDELDGDEVMMKTMQITKPLQSPGFFYMMLVQDKKEPVYHGETVGPKDIGAVLMRWKNADTEYRVIFGDLSARTVTGEQLAELEKQPPK